MIIRTLLAVDSVLPPAENPGTTQPGKRGEDLLLLRVPHTKKQDCGALSA